MFGFAAVIFTANQPYFDSTIKQILISSTINSVAIQLSLIFGLLTVYASSYKKMPRQFVLFVFLSLIFLIQTIFFQTLLESVFNYAFYGYAIAVLFELFRVVIISIYRKDPWGWGWIIGIGFIVAMILIAYQLLIITGVITQPLFGIRMVYVYGIVFLAVTVSINLSKKVSDTNIDLEKQLVHVKELSQKAIEQERKAKEIEFTRRLLEADNERKTRELEEARKLQISMLPANVPAVLNLDISVYMKPATEVGGDYYDFKYNNGSLFIAVGDATGHGMKAGTIVATIKGLFTAESFNSEIVQFMDKTNEVIRDMNMGNLFMAFLIAKINENKLTLSSAGMPPALLYSNKKKNVEEIRLQALPLGGTAGFKYSQLEIPIFPGDTLLLMSDGFPELFNEQKEILDYQPAKEIFTSVADLAPDKIVNELCLAADNWRGNANQEDDITFVVVKLKEK
jgi:serine phosphatase RsbU (regulator of sigma subunit)